MPDLVPGMMEFFRIAFAPSGLPSRRKPGQPSTAETFALARDIIQAHPLPAITMKGISREVIPYSIDNVLDDTAKGDVIVERTAGLDFYLDPSVLDPQGIDRIKAILSDALVALDRRRATPAQ